VLEQVGTILSLVLDGEAARRGYVLTGDPSFLDQYETIPEKLQASLQRLQELTADDAFQQERLKGLKPLIQKKLENLQTSIELRKQQGTALTDQESLTEQGKKMTDQIRRLTGEMQQEERTLLIERAARSQASARTVVSLIALGSLLSLLTVSVSLLIVNLDMSKRKRTENALQTSEERFRTTFENAGIGMALVDRQGHPLKCNPALQKMLGYSETELSSSMLFTEFTHPEDRELGRGLYRELAEGKRDKYDIEKRYFNKDGRMIWGLLVVSLVKDREGVPSYAVGMVQDITERKRAGEALRDSEERYRTLFKKAAEGILVAGTETKKFLYANPAVCRMLGYTEEELAGLSVRDIHPPEDMARVMSEFEAQVRGEKTTVVALPCLRKDGTRIYADITSAVMVIDGMPCNVGFFSDVTERKRAEEALRESEEKYRALIETTGTGYLITDMEGRVLDANSEYVRLTDRGTLQEILGRRVTEWTAQHDLARNAEGFRKCLERGFVRNLELDHVNKDGECTPIEINATLLPSATGVRIVGLCRDITERKRAEQSLREAEEQFRSLFAATPLPTFLWDLETLQYLEVNDAAVLHSGYSRDELLRMRVTDLLPPEAAPRILSQMQVIRTQSRDRNQGRHRLKDGRVVDVEVDAHALPFRGRRAVLVVIQDITERKRTQQALQESEERYRDLAENAAELIQSVSAQGQFLYVNRAWRQTLGYSEGEIARLSITDILSPQHLTPYQQVLVTVMAGETVNDFETVFVAKNGTQIIVEGSVNCRLVDGKAVATSGIFRNVTARREIEKMKNEFVSTVSHELRTPLTSIRGSLGLLAGGLLTADPGKARRMVDIAVTNTDRLVRLINDILDIERIESGRVKMEKRACEAASLMLQAVDAVRELADKAGVKLEVSPGPGRILADPDRVIQTMTNLLDNAIKFSPQGSTISLNLRRQNGDMLFEVKDRGRGIPADRLTVIFERFQQVDASDRREKGGTGLGLAICRSIVEQHGGRIWVESVLGQGSSFYFTLPVMEEQVVPVIPAEEQVVPVIPAEEQVVPVILAEAPGARTVLVCDDDASILAVVQELLEQRGYRVVAVGSGREAVKQAVAQLPDAILLDLLMPEMNGWETMTALRERPETCEIPIIILSVLPPRDLRKTDVEVAGWIQKPVDETLLFQTLSIAITRPGKSARVLVVEDDVDLARVIREVFERHGHKVYLAQTGRQAVQLAEQVLPNLVVLDLVLREGDGFEVVSALRQNKVLHRVPLVVHTAKDLDDAERARLRLGKTVFLTKGRGSHEEFEKQVLGLMKGIMSATVERGSP
jgi:hypothetical protein